MKRTHTHELVCMCMCMCTKTFFAKKINVYHSTDSLKLLHLSKVVHTCRIKEVKICSRNNYKRHM